MPQVPDTILTRAQRAAKRHRTTMYVFVNYAGWHIDTRIPPFGAAYVAVYVDGQTDTMPEYHEARSGAGRAG